jgi:hypothetical protein
MNLTDMYKSILRQTNVEVEIGKTSQQTNSLESHATIKAGVKIPFFGSGEGETGLKGSGGTSTIKEFRTVEYNLALAQDITEILKATKFTKYVVLENFHYLSEDVQGKFAFDLRTFQDVGVIFVILGIWRERNRLTQFNGDLQDRVVEVAVEPWTKDDFKRVVDKGQASLGVNFSEIYSDMVSSSYDSIGVLQELCKETCLAAGVTVTQKDSVKTLTKAHLQTAIDKKYSDYAGRHLKSLEAFSDSSSRSRGGRVPLFIPYYFIRVLIKSDFEKVTQGFKRRDLHNEILAIHHREAETVRVGDMTNFLNNLISYQIQKNIRPPLFDYDKSITTLKIIDSTLYFFLRNCDREEVLTNIPVPSEDLDF